MALSPTRTYLHDQNLYFQTDKSKINGIIHCTGGGQTKVLHFINGVYIIIKDNLFNTPDIFNFNC